jgi:hypothetical protein
MFYEERGGWNIYEIKDSVDIANIIKKVFHNFDGEAIFIKPISGSCGRGARKIRRGTTDVGGDLFKSLVREIHAGSFLFQEEVKQHEDLAKLNPTSLNTIRMDTFKADHGKAEIISAFLRIGLTGSEVDNIAAGGVYVGINLGEGTLKGTGFNKLAMGGFAYKEHPDTKVVFKDLRVPYFEEAKVLVLKAANLLPGALIGWDIGISDYGPILMEGNAIYYDMQLSDVAYGGYRKNPIFQRLLNYLTVRKREA